jgi:hypothetical protein
MPSLELHQTMEAFTRRKHSQVAREKYIRKITTLARAITNYNLFLQRRYKMKKGFCCILCFNKIKLIEDDHQLKYTFGLIEEI